MSDAHNLNPWPDFQEKLLKEAVGSLTQPLKFIQFQRLLVELNNKFLGFCFGENTSYVISQLETPVDIRAFVHCDKISAIVNGAREPWGWPQLLKAMTMPAPGKRMQTRSKDGKPRKVSKETAIAAIEESLLQVVERKGGKLDVQVWTQELVDEAKLVPFTKTGVSEPDIRFFSKAEIIALLNAKRLRADVGARIVAIYRESKSAAARDRAAKRGKNQKMKDWEDRNKKQSRSNHWKH